MLGLDDLKFLDPLSANQINGIHMTLHGMSTHRLVVAGEIASQATSQPLPLSHAMDDDGALN